MLYIIQFSYQKDIDTSSYCLFYKRFAFLHMTQHIVLYSFPTHVYNGTLIYMDVFTVVFLESIQYLEYKLVLQFKVLCHAKIDTTTRKQK